MGKLLDILMPHLKNTSINNLNDVYQTGIEQSFFYDLCSIIKDEVYFDYNKITFLDAMNFFVLNLKSKCSKNYQLKKQIENAEKKAKAQRVKNILGKRNGR